MQFPDFIVASRLPMSIQSQFYVTYALNHWHFLLLFLILLLRTNVVNVQRSLKQKDKCTRGGEAQKTLTEVSLKKERIEEQHQEDVGSRLTNGLYHLDCLLTHLIYTLLCIGVTLASSFLQTILHLPPSTVELRSMQCAIRF